ncbi:lipocalin family protein [Chryseobacterium sp. S90]|uniref:lipocalin family protein n=1 Tax=Chryseobacterium sp. S90 TaxID=3395373 RepID=UPI0039BC40D1
MKKLFLLAILAIMSACNPSSEKKVTMQLAISDSNPNREKLVGKWLQPIAGQQKEQQGFELRENGTVISMNIHTLQYDRWNVSEDTLYLSYHTEGVKLISKGIDTLLIKELDDSELILSPIGANVSDTESYHKEN